MRELLLVSIFARRRTVSELTSAQLDLLVRQARRADLLARLCLFLQSSGQFQDIPDSIQWHFTSALRVTERHAVLVRYEVGLIHEALESIDTPVVILKGAAYVMTDLPPAAGRMFTDIDIMVPKFDLDLAERQLHGYGWMDGKLDAYDQRYYRRWMHELPPKKHRERKTVLDVHHAILPETARVHPDSKKLFAAAQPVEGFNNLFVLCPEDMILHSIVHLFHDGEFEHGLRDLLDIQGLLAHFSSSPGFWVRLLDRAGELELTRPLYYALHDLRKLLDAGIPDEVMRAAAATGAPAQPLRGFMNGLILRGLLPKHASCRDALSGLTDWMLYVRSHFLRMPPHLLIPHLFHKAFITPYLQHLEAKKAANRMTVQDFLKR